MNVGIFFKCIEAVHNVSPEGFAAIKVTALGLPAILERLSTAILEAQKLFSKFDRDGTGRATRNVICLLNSYRKINTRTVQTSPPSVCAKHDRKRIARSYLAVFLERSVLPVLIFSSFQIA